MNALMKVCLILLLTTLPSWGQIQTITGSETFPLARVKLNNNFSFLNTNKSGIGACTNSVVTAVTTGVPTCTQMGTSFFGVASLTGNGSRLVTAAATIPADGCATWLGGNLGSTGQGCGSGTGTGGGADANGYFVVTRSANAPANAFNLASLSDGILKMTVSNGIASFGIAQAGGDYQAPIAGAPSTWPTGFTPSLHTHQSAAQGGGLDAAAITAGVLSIDRIPTLNQNTDGNAATATRATNLAEGSAGQIPKQTGPGATTFCDPNVANCPVVLDNGGNAPIPGSVRSGTPSVAALAALPIGAHGFACDESSTAGVPATGVDYIRCKRGVGLVQSINGGAETPIGTGGGGGLADPGSPGLVYRTEANVTVPAIRNTHYYGPGGGIASDDLPLPTAEAGGKVRAKACNPVTEKVTGLGTDAVLTCAPDVSGGSGIGRATLSATWTDIPQLTCQVQNTTWDGITTADTIKVAAPTSLPANVTGPFAVIRSPGVVEVGFCNMGVGDAAMGAFSMSAVISTSSVSGSAELDFGSIEDMVPASLTFTIVGALAGDRVDAKCPATLEADVFCEMRATGTNTVTVTLLNMHGQPVNPAPQVFAASIAK
jgi:hypothetical protein